MISWTACLEIKCGVKFEIGNQILVTRKHSTDNNYGLPMISEINNLNLNWL